LRLAVPPKFVAHATLFAPTNIGFPRNAGIAVSTTQHDTETLHHVFTVTAQEGTSTGFGRAQFHQLLCASLAASTDLLSSVTAF